ncbi:ABC transporter substrate-binding protein [Chryseobacterium camelliae]|uniref:ABC transporter substrate-binding protein n=1 Tax=Chryseobacterium camelliae TaxID=1265445 RepID=A0ABY7QQC5_9FLAO|nr:ABC transporter substrate-binding protein [Chryseobacterium camelliae]WBV61236.1 ABC transporter substrate-binding protein [Chryseobacterium camelliae]
MKSRFFLIFAICALISCKRDPKNSFSQGTSISKYVQYNENGDVLKLKSGNFTYDFKKSQIPFKKVVLLNASMAGYIAELGAEDVIVGVSSPEYIFSENIQRKLKEGQIKNVGNEQKYDVEKIISLQPDAIFTNHIASFDNSYQLLKNNGIQVIFLDEYNEQKPLEKAAYLKLFGKLLGMEKKADEKYSEVEKNYNELKKLALQSTEKPVVLANEMYGDVWYLPGGKTSVANFISDANAQYIVKDNTEEKAMTMSFEEVFSKSKGVKYWVNAGSHTSKKEMLNMNPFYGKLDVFNTGKVYGIAGREREKANDFFESGIVRADWVLKDYIKIFHPDLLPNYKLTYMKELQ